MFKGIINLFTRILTYGIMMKNLFCGFYGLSDEDYAKLWSEGVVILDTNVLLDLHRLPKSSRDVFLVALEKIKERLWLPFHAALEYQRNRASILYGGQDTFKATRDAEVKNFESLISKIKELKLDAHPKNSNISTLIEQIDSAKNDFKKLTDAFLSDEWSEQEQKGIQKRIDALFEGKVGPQPKDKEEYCALIKDGEFRYENEIPPGFKDATKVGSFSHNGIVYESKYGDLIIWNQIINYAKKENKKYVMFITRDEKEDWWGIEKGKKTGPHPQLIHEIIRLSGVEIFWMYTSANFFKMQSSSTQSNEVTKDIDELAMYDEVSRIDFKNRSYSRRLHELSNFFNSKNGIKKINKLGYNLQNSSVYEYIFKKYDGNYEFLDSSVFDLVCFKDKERIGVVLMGSLDQSEIYDFFVENKILINNSIIKNKIDKIEIYIMKNPWEFGNDLLYFVSHLEGVFLHGYVECELRFILLSVHNGHYKELFSHTLSPTLSYMR